MSQRGHFYFGQLGHYHFGITGENLGKFGENFLGNLTSLEDFRLKCWIEE